MIVEGMKKRAFEDYEEMALNLRKEKDNIYSSFGRNEENKEAQGGKTE